MERVYRFGDTVGYAIRGGLVLTLVGGPMAECFHELSKCGKEEPHLIIVTSITAVQFLGGRVANVRAATADAVPGSTYVGSLGAQVRRLTLGLREG